MNKRVVSVLGAIVLLLLGYLFVFERGSLTSKELAERKGRVLQTFGRDRVEELELVRGKERVAFTRKRLEDGTLGSFTMTSPRREEADESAIDGLLGELEWLSARRVIDSPTAADLSQFGLDAPAFTVSYRAGDAATRLRVGKADVHGDNYYAQVEGEPRVLVVPKTLVEALDHSPGHFRTKQFLGDIVSAWARKLDVQSGAASTHLEKYEGHWWVTDAPRSFADDTRVRAAVKALDGLRATRYLEGEALARVSGPALVPVATLTLKTIPEDAREDVKPEAFTVTVYGACPEHADERVARSGTDGDLACVLSADARALLDLGDMREHHLLPADPNEVEHITLVDGTGVLDLRRKDADWEAVKGGASPDTAAVEGWLASLRAVTGSYGESRPFAAGARLLTLGLVGDRRVRIDVAGPIGGPLELVREGENVALHFAGDAPLLLTADSRRTEPLRLFAEHKPSEVVAVEVRVGDTRRKLVLEGGVFRAGGAPVADTLRVRELVRDVLKSEALAYLGQGGRAEHGLERPSAELRLGLGAAGVLSLRVGVGQDGGFVVSVEGRGVYVADKALVAQLHELAGVPVPAALLPERSPDGDDGEDDEGEHEHGADEHVHP
jgi:Fe2+ transport system protein FeoA